MTTLQAFLRGGQTIADLKKVYALKIHQHPRYPNLYLFKYNQISSPFEEKIVQEARGLILDADQDWAIVSYPYDKFFNHGEKLVAELDWSNSRVYEKLDGSLMTLYHYNDEWLVSSSGMPDASGPVNSQHFTFADLFWKIWHELGYQLPIETDHCFMFELLSPSAQIVVPQKKNRLVLHGARCLKTLQEELPEKYVNQYEIAKTYKFDNFDDCLLFARQLPASEGEGFVVCDDHFNRCKIKGEMYVTMAFTHSKKKNEINHLKVLSIIQMNEGNEFLSIYPDWTQDYQNLKTKYDQLVKEIESSYQIFANEQDQKTFAQSIKHLWYRDAFFQLRNQKIESVNEWLSQYNIKKLYELL